MLKHNVKHFSLIHHTQPMEGSHTRNYMLKQKCEYIFLLSPNQPRKDSIHDNYMLLNAKTFFLYTWHTIRVFRRKYNV